MKTKKIESARTKARREARKQTKFTHSPNFANTIKSSKSDFMIWAVDRKNGHTLMIPTTTEHLKELRTSLKAQFSQEDMNAMFNSTIRKPEVRVAVSKELYGLNENHDQTQVETNDFESPMGEFAVSLQGWVAYTASESLGDSNFVAMSFDFDNSNHATLYGTANCPNLDNSQNFGWFLLASIMEQVPSSKRKGLLEDLSPQVQQNVNSLMDMVRKYK